MKSEKYVEPAITPANASKPAPPLGPAVLEPLSGPPVQSPNTAVSGRVSSVLVFPQPTVADASMGRLGGIMQALINQNKGK